MHFRERYLSYIQRDVEVYAFRKRGSLLMLFLSKILFFLPDFMENFTTTIGHVIYLNDKSWRREDLGVLALLAHECQHVWDNERVGLLYGIGYLFPQILCLGAIGCVWGGPWWLLFLAALLPWPAPFRMIIERRGYLLTLIIDNMLSQNKASAIKAQRIENVVKQFVGKNYYYMWPFKRRLRAWFGKRMLEEAERGRAGNLPILETTKRFIELP